MSIPGPLRLERVADGIGMVLLHRPDSLNALDTKLAEAIVGALDELAHDPLIRVGILTGSGERAFCAGADLKERSGMTVGEWDEQHAVLERAFAAVRDFPKPLLAAVNGIALGGGCELALNCDFIIAAEGARFGQPEVRLGIMPGGGGTQLLPRRIPGGLARQLLLTGDWIDASEAYRCGLVNDVQPPERLREAALEIARRLATNSPAAIRAIRASIREGEALPIAEAMQQELRHYRSLIQHPDRIGGLAAFNENRTARFRDPT